MKRDQWKSKWERLHLLSKDGGQGFTYYARPLNSEASASHVIKILKRQDDAERRARMYREVANLKTLDHPGVARVVDGNTDEYKDDVELFFVTEFIPGDTLQHRITKNRLHVRDAALLTLKLLSTLEYCHGQNILHRDHKPDNVVLRDDSVENPVVIDFGLSFNLELDQGSFETPSEQHIGNRFLLLPEYGVAGDEKRDAISDITQHVGLFFYSLTGIAPSHLIDSANSRPHQRKPALEFLAAAGIQIGQSLNRIFDVGFAHERLRRWQSVSALRAELSDLLEGEKIALTLSQRIATTKQRLLETPRFAIVDRLDHLNNCVRRDVKSVFVEIQKELRDAVIKVQRISIQDTSISDQSFTGFAFCTRYEPEAKVKLSVVGCADKGEYVLTGIKNEAKSEILRLGVFDPDAEARIRQRVEAFFMDSIERVLT